MDQAAARPDRTRVPAREMLGVLERQLAELHRITQSQGLLESVGRVQATAMKHVERTGECMLVNRERGVDPEQHVDHEVITAVQGDRRLAKSASRIELDWQVIGRDGPRGNICHRHVVARPRLGQGERGASRPTPEIFVTITPLGIETAADVGK
ncbi:MAG TPA: hypothetical protein VLM79_18415 [Kofleriaceae bacterium]|nr:hypothetical protein [Kofleriaceae bacterium]